MEHKNLVGNQKIIQQIEKFLTWNFTALLKK
jgi:hypothetical protein